MGTFQKSDMPAQLYFVDVYGNLYIEMYVTSNRQKKLGQRLKKITLDICVAQSSSDILHTKDPRLQQNSDSATVLLFEVLLECQISVLNSPNGRHIKRPKI